jgi:hypothetical protein
MRRTLLVGFSLTLAAVAAVLVSGWLDLELETVALLGAAAGAIVALVPDRTPSARLAGFLGGFAIAWVGYVVRAATLPDSSGGKAVVVALVLGLSTLLVIATRGWLPLWATLLGAGAFAGAYEPAYVAAPTEVLSTSLSTATMLLATSAIGFLAVTLASPMTRFHLVPTDLPVQRDRAIGDTVTTSSDLPEMEIAR